MPQTQYTSGLPTVETERSSGIHLVTLPKAIAAAPVAAPKLNVPRHASRKSEPVRESEKMSTLALAGAALIAPAIWVGHAVLVWLDIF